MSGFSRFAKARPKRGSLLNETRSFLVLDSVGVTSLTTMTRIVMQPMSVLGDSQVPVLVSQRTRILTAYKIINLRRVPYLQKTSLAWEKTAHLRMASSGAEDGAVSTMTVKSEWERLEAMFILWLAIVCENTLLILRSSFVCRFHALKVLERFRWENDLKLSLGSRFFFSAGLMSSKCSNAAHTRFVAARFYWLPGAIMTASAHRLLRVVGKREEMLEQSSYFSS
jgi:hypothetical protein